MNKQLIIIALFFVFLPFLSPIVSGQNSYVQNDIEAITFDNKEELKIANGFAGGSSVIKDAKEPLIKLKLKIADTFRVNVLKSWELAYGVTSILNRSINNIYELSEDLTVNGDWIDSHDYFAVWDSKKVNPYDFDPTKYQDSISIALKNRTENWLSPIADTTKVNSEFGMRRYRWHYGVDLDLNRGDTVVAVADGIVRIAQYDRYGYGNYVVLRHKNGLETLYGHFLKRIVRVGQEVKQGDVIGLGGSTGRSTGYHLHFEVRYKGAAINPGELYDFEENQLKNDHIAVNPQTFQYITELRKKRYYRIRSGDTLGRISRRYRTTITKVCRLNGISRNKILRVGRTLRVK